MDSIQSVAPITHLQNPEESAQNQFRLGYRPGLDGFRGIAILSVLFFHSTAPHWTGGFIGVDLFFVLSGCLITLLLCQEIALNSRIDLKHFYIRRVLRLAPALIFFLLCYTVIVLVTVPNPRILIEDALITLFYFSNWFRVITLERPSLLGHTWSLSIEEQFYLIWPLLFIILFRVLKKPAYIFWFIVAGALGAIVLRNMLLFSDASPMRLYNGLDTRADALLIGCALGFGMANGILKPTKSVTPHIFIICISALFFIFLGATASWNSQFMLSLGYSLIALCSAHFMFVQLNYKIRLLQGITCSTILVWLGKRSYGIYLWHFPIMKLLHVQFNNWIIVLIGGGILALLIANISYHWIEQPFLKLKRSFSHAQ